MYTLCIFVQVLSLHTAINNNNNLCPSCLHLSPHLSPIFLPPLGNSDSGKWDSRFEGETSACGRSAGLRRGSERDKRMHTGKDGWMEYLIFTDGWWEARHIRDGNRHISINDKAAYCFFFLSYKPLCLSLQGVRLGVRPDSPPLPRPSRAVKVETGCNVGNPCVSSPCPSHSRCSDQWERHACVCEPGEWTQRWCWFNDERGTARKLACDIMRLLRASWELDFLFSKKIFFNSHLCNLLLMWLIMFLMWLSNMQREMKEGCCRAVA